MICAICGEDKSPYHFTQFTHMDDDARYFFIHIRRYPNGNPRNDVCWECNGVAGYRCLGCGNIKSTSEFRVQGRYCHACKSTWKGQTKRTKTRAAQRSKADIAIGARNGLESGVFEE